MAWLVEHLDIGAGRVTVDLAAGTGKLTRLLEPLGADLLAVEPVEGMRADPPRGAPRGSRGRGDRRDARPFASESAGRDHRRAGVPLVRRRRGARRAAHACCAPAAGSASCGTRAIGASTGWTGSGVVLDRVEKHAPWRVHESWSETDFPFDRWFGPVHRAEFTHEQPLSPEDVVGRFKGVSHIAVLPEPEQERVLGEVREILATHPDTAGRTELRIPYRVDAYWCERLP